MDTSLHGIWNWDGELRYLRFFRMKRIQFDGVFQSFCTLFPFWQQTSVDKVVKIQLKKKQTAVPRSNNMDFRLKDPFLISKIIFNKMFNNFPYFAFFYAGGGR